LRFALDENTPAIVEATAKALAFLFYNDTDETLCDVLYETALAVYQPALEKQKVSTNFVLDEAFSDISLEGGHQRETTKPAYASNLDDEELENKESMTDFHMAEADLVECLLRTNILERIRYILFTMHPEEAVVVTLVKVLIRLARTNRETAMKILMTGGLVDSIIGEFLVPIESSDERRYEPQYMVLKLFRVIASYDIGMMLKLQNMGVLEVVEKYVFTRRDVTVSGSLEVFEIGENE
jgi:RNA polymerase II-associated protein 1